MLYSKLGDDRRAEEDFSRVIELEPDNAEALQNRAAARDDLGEHRLAREDYDALIRLEPDNAVALYGWGACLAKLGDLAGAVEDFDQAIALDQEARYACNEDHSTDGRGYQPLEIHAHTTDRQVISGVLGAVLTEKSVSTVRSAIKELDEKESTSTTFPDEDISLLKEDLYFFLRAAGGAENARNFLAMFICALSSSRTGQ